MAKVSEILCVERDAASSRRFFSESSVVTCAPLPQFVIIALVFCFQQVVFAPQRLHMNYGLDRLALFRKIPQNVLNSGVDPR